MDAVLPVVGHAKYASCVSHRGFHFVSFSLSRVNYTDKQAASGGYGDIISTLTCLLWNPTVSLSIDPVSQT
ncbi:hypothetical protein VTP01DRAFT_5565, partial [Rhizomucor pusillus]|uniref:uncharacterized protein n=1 Tax=Rhizomucor pusillus TaxID=4840 RepID=UPI003743650D